MKSLFKITALFNVVLCLTMVLFPCTVAQAEVSYEDVIVLTCPKGTGPGEFFYMWSGGVFECPRCFAVDKAGTFYIPETYYDKIRLHKFDRNGKFMIMLKLEGKTSGVYGIAISPTNEIFLITKPSTKVDQVIYKYNSEGELIYKLGSNGIVNSNDEEMFEGFMIIRRIITAEDGGIFIEQGEGYGKTAAVFRFDSKGNLLGKRESYPDTVAKNIETHTIQYKFLTEREPKLSIIHSLIGPDGHFYYMKLHNWKKPPNWKHGYPQELQIHKVIF